MTLIWHVACGMALHRMDTFREKHGKYISLVLNALLERDPNTIESEHYGVHNRDLCGIKL